MTEEKFPNSRKPSHWQACAEFWNLSRQHNWEGEKKKERNPQNMSLTTTASREVAQTLMSPTREWGLGREVQAASSILMVRTRPECPEDNLRELK